MFFYLLILVIFILIFNRFLLRKNFLISITGDVHQKFASYSKVPLTGGVLIFLGYLYFLDKDNYLYISFSFMVLILGFFSDLKIIKSAFRRFLFQAFLVITFVIFSDTQISQTRIIILDKFLTENIINYIFVAFCILILMNGSNFIDGLNTLSLGYYSLISIVLLYLISYQNINLKYISIEYLICLLASGFILNIKNKIYLGDSGSYLLGFSFSIFLIDIYNSGQNISPFFIVLLLWYPCYENLFSIIRKKILKRSPMTPDTNHFHQLVFFFIKKRYKMKNLLANLVTAQIINFYHLIIFLVAINYIKNSEIQISLILFNITVYTIIYFKTFLFKYNKGEKIL
ncbi:undecaprenyl/decaprenyl-phosphate alpha-N-acetylglucosaminyl 1-phosphate transferase [Candidatus Pelagibacter sp.]|nr:undecaprenyl/decaprenyl-phosphate alpha-N-acetylglucosaminyl 1-phosphate transferase [Candidatus Pelagibacter sp.]